MIFFQIININLGAGGVEVGVFGNRIDKYETQHILLGIPRTFRSD